MLERVQEMPEENGPIIIIECCRSLGVGYTSCGIVLRVVKIKIKKSRIITEFSKFNSKFRMDRHVQHKKTGVGKTCAKEQNKAIYVLTI